MPQVTIRGLSRADTAALAGRISDLISETVSVPREWITVEHQDAAFFSCGEPVPHSVFVQIQWRQRPHELEKAVADRLSALFGEAGCRKVEIYFSPMDMDSFYESHPGAGE